MNDIHIINGHYIIHVYLNKYIYMYWEEYHKYIYIYLSKERPSIIYIKGPYSKSMPHTCNRGYEENNYIHVYTCILMEHHNKLTYNLQQRLLQAAAEIITQNNIDVMPILNYLNYIWLLTVNRHQNTGFIATYLAGVGEFSEVYWPRTLKLLLITPIPSPWLGEALRNPLD